MPQMEGETLPRISVLIVNYNGHFELERCLSSIFRENPGEDIEVIVIDNASTDRSRLLEKKWPIKWIQLPRNLGYGAALNVGASSARADYIFILNNDIAIPNLNTCFELSDFLKANEDYACAAPKLLHLDGSLQETCRTLPSLWGEILELLGLARLVPERFGGFLMSERGHAYDADVEQVAGAAMMLRKVDFLALGGFDERFPLYYEDVDLCLRLSALGKLRYMSNVVMVHASKATASRYPLRTIVAIAAGRYKYFLIHKGRVSAECTRVISILRFFTRSIALFFMSLFSCNALNREARHSRSAAYLLGIPYLVNRLDDFNALEI